MTNKLSETKFFNSMDQKFGFSNKIQKINLNDYAVPKELYLGRIDAFKGYKIPLANQVYNYLKEGKIVPVLFNESSNPNKILPNLHTEYGFPNSMFNMISIVNGKPIVLIDLSYKGKYDKDKGTNNPIYLDIPDIHFFYMALAGYINLRLVEDPNISAKTGFYEIISSTYSLIMTKIIDNMFPIASSSNNDYDKLYMLCSQFCLESMFKLNKESAAKYSTKTIGVVNKNDVLASSVYLNSPDKFFNKADFKNIYPIDNFCNTVCDEYSYILPNKFTPNILLLKYTTRLTRNSIFTMEHLGSFINMIILSKGGLGIFNDVMIKRYLEIMSKDPLKEIANLVS